jgi:ABC-type sugar transport system permease subunit
MAASSKSIYPVASPPEGRTNLYLKLLSAWHLVLTIAAVVGLAMVWANTNETAQWMKILMTAALILVGGASIAAVRDIRRKQHRGRVFSLMVNYLGFLVSLLWGMHVLGIYTGIDSLADTFGRGVPYIGLLIVAYLLSSFGDRFEDRPSIMLKIQRVSRYIAWVGLLLFLIAVGIIPGLLSFIAKFSEPLSILLGLGAVVFGVFIWMMWREPTAQIMGAKSSDQVMLNGYLLLSPNLLGFLFFFAGPLLFSLYISFTDADAFAAPTFIGLSNYAEIFDLVIARLASMDQPAREVIDIAQYDELARQNLFGAYYVLGARDKLFWVALGNTFRFMLFAVPLSVVPALFIANILNSKIPGMKVFRAIYFVPSIAAVVGVSLIWRWLYNSTVGYINYFITNTIDFLNTTFSATIADPAIGWLSDVDVALFAVVLVAAWQWTGFNTVLFLAGMQGISGTLYEAATVDGAGSWDKFWRITLPLLAPTTFFVVTTTTIQAMQIFDQVFVLTNPPGGPGTSTTTIVLYLYQQGFRNFRQGYASALAWVLFLLIFGLTLFQFQRQRASSGEA